MSELLRPGQAVRTRQGAAFQVERFLGGGGQGEVYLATWDGRPFALKWYYPEIGTAEQWQAIESLIEKGPPSDRFLWPVELAKSKEAPAYGYVMPLREPRFKSLHDLMRKKIDPSYRALVAAGLNLVGSYRKLHAQGWCYKDISFGNAFLDPDNGDVLICDNDNVRPNRASVSGVFGTTGFMAPEIERREAMPSRQTDLFSLAVLLFWMFHVNHPLVGKEALGIRIFDLAAKEKLYGKKPLFIFDPNDRSNEAVDGKVDPLCEAGANALQTWPIFPAYYRDCVVKAFTKGLHDPDDRVTEGEWLAMLSRLRDSIFLYACGAENFYDPSTMKNSGGRPGRCWSCRESPQVPFRIRILKSIIMLNFDSKLYRHHIDDQHELDFDQVVAEVVPHPTNRNIWGLRNCGKEKWVASIPPDAAKGR